MNTFQKRMSSVLMLLAFRGGLVDATEAGFTQGNRQAAAFVYSGILAGGGATPPTPAAAARRNQTAPLCVFKGNQT